MGLIETKVAAQPTAVVATASTSTRREPTQSHFCRLTRSVLPKRNKTTPVGLIRTRHSAAHTAKAPGGPTHESILPGTPSLEGFATQPNSSFSDLAIEELSTQLLKAVKSGDQVAVERITEVATKKSFPIVNIRGMWESTPLIYACQYCHEGIALWLIQKGADIRLSNEKGVTPLLLASLEGMCSVVQQILLEMQDGKRGEGYNPIDHQIGVVYNSMVDMNVCLSPLLAASMNGHEAVVRLLLQHGANVDIGVSLSQSSNNNGGHGSWDLGNGEGCRMFRYSLLAAAKYGHASVIQALVEYGANVNVIDGNDNHALHLACDSGNEDCALALLRLLCSAAHESLKKPNRNGYTALHYCAIHGLASAAELMLVELKWGVDRCFVNAVSLNRQETALLVACRKKHFTVVTTLLQNGADLMLADRGATSAFAVLQQLERDDLINLYHGHTQAHCCSQQQICHSANIASTHCHSRAPDETRVAEPDWIVPSHSSGNVGAHGKELGGQQRESEEFDDYRQTRAQSITSINPSSTSQKVKHQASGGINSSLSESANAEAPKTESTKSIYRPASNHKQIIFIMDHTASPSPDSGVEGDNCDDFSRVNVSAHVVMPPVFSTRTTVNSECAQSLHFGCDFKGRVGEQSMFPHSITSEDGNCSPVRGSDLSESRVESLLVDSEANSSRKTFSRLRKKKRRSRRKSFHPAPSPKESHAMILKSL